MNKITRLSLEAMSTEELLALHNRLTGKDTKKFASRAKGLEQTIRALGEDFVEFTGDVNDPCPLCGGDRVNTTPLDDGNGNEDYDECHTCGGIFHVATGLPKRVKSAGAKGDNSAGVAQSWNDPEVRAKRLTRNGVLVDGKHEFRSVREAFIQLALPINAHIRFRMKLKASGKETFEGHEFALL